MTVKEFQAYRFSVRKYMTDDVEDSLIDSIVKDSRSAPSWKNMQCARWIAVKDKKRILKTTEFCSPGNQWLKNVPVLLILIARPEDSGIRNGKKYYLVDAAIAMEHLTLSAFDNGLGTCWIGAFDEKPLKELYQIPDPFEIIGLSPLGYPAHQAKPRERKSVEEILFREQWPSG